MEGLLDLSLEALGDLAGSRTRALAVRRWLQDARPLPGELPERIPGVTPKAWAAVRAGAPLPPWRTVRRQQAADGTTKYALDLGGVPVEAVLIPARGRSTVCLSTQSGCTRHCSFCATAALGFRRQLTTGEIVLQYVLAQADAPADGPARNVVFMGMGEPLDNLEAVLPAVERLREKPFPALAAGHITVSTSGVVPGMRRFLRESRAHLALSLNATTDEVRERVMPHNRRWPIAALLDVLRGHAALEPERRVFIEYVLWEGINDSRADAERLGALLAGLPAHVNLIPHNAHGSSVFRPPAPEAVLAFQECVRASGLRCMIRWPRGRDIAAACGQLAGAGANPIQQT